MLPGSSIPASVQTAGAPLYGCGLTSSARSWLDRAHSSVVPLIFESTAAMRRGPRTTHPITDSSLQISLPRGTRLAPPRQNGIRSLCQTAARFPLAKLPDRSRRWAKRDQFVRTTPEHAGVVETAESDFYRAA